MASLEPSELCHRCESYPTEYASLCDLGSLHLAVANGDLEELRQLLLRTDIKNHIRNKQKRLVTPLSIACERGHAEVADLLIQHGANVNAQCCGGEGYSPLHRASYSGHLECLRLLVKHGADVNLLGRSCKDCASDDLSDPRTALSHACVHEGEDRAEIVKALLSFGARVEVPTPARAPNAFDCACISGQAGAAEVFLSAGHMVDGWWAERLLHGICQTQYTLQHSVVGNLLITNGAHVDSIKEVNEEIPLHIVCAGGACLKMARMLIDHGSDFEKAGVDGLESIHIAATENRFDIIRLLASKKISCLLRPSSVGKLALHYVSKPAAAKALLEAPLSNAKTRWMCRKMLTRESDTWHETPVESKRRRMSTYDGSSQFQERTDVEATISYLESFEEQWGVPQDATSTSCVMLNPDLHGAPKVLALHTYFVLRHLPAIDPVVFEVLGFLSMSDFLVGRGARKDLTMLSSSTFGESIACCCSICNNSNDNSNDNDDDNSGDDKMEAILAMTSTTMMAPTT